MADTSKSPTANKVRYWKEHAKGCALSGIPFKRTDEKNGGMYNASVDRIDQNKGYIKSNCRLVLWCVNAFRGIGTDNDILEVAKCLVKRQ